MLVRGIVVAATMSALLAIGPARAAEQLPSLETDLAQATMSGASSKPGQDLSVGAYGQAPKSVDPAPEVVGVADGEIVMKPASTQHRTFFFRLKNPPESRSRKFVLKLLPQPSGSAGLLQIKLDPEEFTLAPGQVQPVSATLADAPVPGEYSGVLLISDPEQPGVQQDFTMTIEGPAAPWWQTPFAVFVIIAVLVFLGAALSALLSVAFPASLSKRRNRRRLRDLAQDMGENLAPGTAHEMKLAVELNRLELLNDRIRWYSTRATELIQEVSSLTDGLEQKMSVATGLDACRARLRTATVPPSIVPRASDQLDSAAMLLVRGDAEQARKMLTETEQLVEWTEATTTQVQESLAKNIGELVKQKGSIEDSYIKDLIERKLEPSLSELAPGQSVPRHRLLDLDQECYAAHLYLFRYKGDIAKRHEYAASKDWEKRLLKELKSGDTGLLRAVALLDDLDSGVEPEEIKAALTGDPPAAEISIHPPQPAPEQTTSFEFRFRNRRLDDSPLAAKLKYTWNFGDGSSPALGKKCVHFFAESCKRTEGYSVQVDVRDSAGNGGQLTEKCTVKSAPKRDRGMKYIELSAFFISFLVAWVLALSFHYTGSEQLNSLNDLVTPFLWGFGLDQVKDRATNFTELMRSVPQSTSSPAPAAQGGG